MTQSWDHMLPFLVLFLAIGLPIICGTILALAFIFRSRSSSGRRLADREETQLIQEMHHTCLRLEERIAALETILFESERKKNTK